VRACYSKEAVHLFRRCRQAARTLRTIRPNASRSFRRHTGLDPQTPGMFSGVALAKHALFPMLCFARNFRTCHYNLRSGMSCLSMTSWGKTLGVIGLRTTGCEIAKRASAMGMLVMAIVKDVSRRRCPRSSMSNSWAGPSSQYGVRQGTLSLASCTRDLADAAHDWTASPRAHEVSINVARGEIVDESEMIEALQTDHIRNAGLDVFTIKSVDSAQPPNYRWTP